ncbi:MAG: ATP-binding cassette domain-containing protein, partial [Promicromonosporaceae bacterium]|nr:ATP-binding cassette domain-containing protein [Promicromonosporaceae bacterium]
MQLIARDVTFAYPAAPAERGEFSAAGRGADDERVAITGQGTRRPTGLAGGQTTVIGSVEAGDEVLRGVSVRISGGTRLGVVGENGSGKSTLLHLLAGGLQPTSGTIRRVGTLATVEQELLPEAGQTVGDVVQGALAAVRAVETELQAALAEAAGHEPAGQESVGPGPVGHESTGRHSVGQAAAARLDRLLARAEHLEAWDADRRVDVALTRLGACRDYARPLATLSVGERYRVRLAARLVERADLLLLDEPTNHLDAAAIGYVTEELRAWRGGVVLVTHDRQLLDDVATAILDLDPSIDGSPVLYGAPGYLEYRFAKAQALARWRQRFTTERKRAVALAERLDATYEGLSDEWRPPKGSQKHRRATRARIHVKAADRLVERLQAESVPLPPPPPHFVLPDLPTADPGWNLALPLIELRSPQVVGDRVGPDGSDRAAGGEAVAPGVRLDLPGTRVVVPPGGRLLVVGPNGSGKSTLLGALAGTLPLARGARETVPGLRWGLVGQENTPVVDRDLEGLVALGRAADGAQAALDRNLTGFAAAANEVLRLLARGHLDPDQVVPIASLGLLSEDDLDRPLVELSVGQRRRFELARTLVAAPHLLILDEPTNHLSIDLVDDLTRALART